LSYKKRQHYLPQFYLKGFATRTSLENNNPEVWLYIRNTAEKSHYYSWVNEKGEWDHTKDSELSELENSVAPLIKKIDRNVIKLIKHQTSESQIDQLETVDASEISGLLHFVVSMMTRVPAVIDKMSENVEEGLGFIFGDNLYEKDSNLTKQSVIPSALSIGAGLSKENDFHKIFLSREISVAYVPDFNASLITSDNPVWRWRREGDDGIKYEDTEINLPLTQHCQLLITGKNKGKPLSYFKIHDKQAIEGINSYIAHNSKAFIVGRDKLLLNRIAKSQEWC